MNIGSKKNYTRSAASTGDQVIFAGRMRLYGIYPELAANTGTITMADHATATGTDFHVCAIGLLAAGKTFGPGGISLSAGLTIKQSVSTDRMLFVWEPE